MPDLVDHPAFPDFPVSGVHYRRNAGPAANFGVPRDKLTRQGQAGLGTKMS
jgi:hypothetical protein